MVIRNCTRIKTKLKAGQMVLWLSSMGHCGGSNILPISQMQYNTRISTYVSMVPKSLCCKKEIEARKKIVKKITTTSHLPVVPGKRVGTFKKRTKNYLPQLWSKPEPIRNPPIVYNYENTECNSEYGKLIGF